MAGTTKSEEREVRTAEKPGRVEPVKSIHAKGGVVIHSPWGPVGESMQPDETQGHVMYVDWAKRVVVLEAWTVLEGELEKLTDRTYVPVEALQNIRTVTA